MSKLAADLPQRLLWLSASKSSHHHVPLRRCFLCQDSWGRDLVKGYGCIHLPIAAGRCEPLPTPSLHDHTHRLPVAASAGSLSSGAFGPRFRAAPAQVCQESAALQTTVGFARPAGIRLGRRGATDAAKAINARRCDFLPVCQRDIAPANPHPFRCAAYSGVRPRRATPRPLTPLLPFVALWSRTCLLPAVGEPAEYTDPKFVARSDGREGVRQISSHTPSAFARVVC